MTQDLIQINEDKHKVIKLRDKEYIADMGILNLPFPADYEKTKKINEEIIDRTITNMKVHQKDDVIEINGHNTLGVPTLSDKQCFFAIERIFIKQIKEIYGEFVLTKDLDKLTTKERTTLPINITELAKEMGYKNPGVKQKAIVCDMIRRLTAVTYTTKKSKLARKGTDEFIVEAEQAFHLIEDYKLVKFTEEKKKKNQKHASKFSNDEEKSLKYQEYKEKLFDGYVKITLSPVAYGAMVEDHYLFYYLNDANKLKNNIASCIYFLTLKWSGKKKFTTVNIDTLLGYIVFRDDMDYKYKKRNIKNAIDKLKESGLCQISELNNGSYMFNYSKKQQTFEPTYLTDKFNTIPDLINGYKELGFKDDELDFIYNDLINLHHYQAMLRMVTMLSNPKYKYNKISKPKEYMVSMLDNMDNIEVKKEYYNKIS